MRGLTLSIKEQNRLHILNGVLERCWSMGEAASLLGVSERQGWRLLAAYRKDGALRWRTRTGAKYNPGKPHGGRDGIGCQSPLERRYIVVKLGSLK